MASLDFGELIRTSPNTSISAVKGQVVPTKSDDDGIDIDWGSIGAGIDDPSTTFGGSPFTGIVGVDPGTFAPTNPFSGGDPNLGIPPITDENGNVIGGTSIGNIGGANGGVTVGDSSNQSADTNNGVNLGGSNGPTAPVTTTFGGGTGAPGAIGNPNLGISGTAPTAPGTTVNTNPGSVGMPTTSTQTPGTTINNNTAPASSGPSLLDLAPGLAQAYQQWQQSQNILNETQGYASQLNPYGAYRDASAQNLQNLENDPSSITATPGYQFSLSQGLGSVANRDNRSFGVGAGSTNPDLMNYASGLASTTYNNTIAQLQAQAGVNIGPQTEGSMLQTGVTQSVASQNAAMAAIGAMLSKANGTSGLTSQALTTLQSAFPGVNLTNLFPNQGLGGTTLNVQGGSTNTNSNTTIPVANQFGTGNGLGSNADGSADPDPPMPITPAIDPSRGSASPIPFNPDN